MLDYRGGKTTLCAGCGHNAISERIIDAFYRDGHAAGARDEDERHRLLVEDARRTFMSRSFSFNTVHGRMPSVATGALLANKT